MSKANCAVVTYTAIFGSEKAPEESKAPGGNEQHDPTSGQTETPDTAKMIDDRAAPRCSAGSGPLISQEVIY